MTISDLLKSGAAVSITVNVADLKEFALFLLDEAKTLAVQEVQSQVEDETLTAKEVKERYHIGDTALWRWEKRGYLIPNRLGNRRLYSKNKIEKLIKGGAE